MPGLISFASAEKQCNRKNTPFLIRVIKYYTIKYFSNKKDTLTLLVILCDRETPYIFNSRYRIYERECGIWYYTYI